MKNLMFSTALLIVLLTVAAMISQGACAAAQAAEETSWYSPVRDLADYHDAALINKELGPYFYPEGTYSRPGTPTGFAKEEMAMMTRAEFAHAVCSVWLALEHGGRSFSPDEARKFEVDKRLQASLSRLTVTFVPGYASLRRNMTAVQIYDHIGTSRPFEDVPAGHWAWSAVETLRTSGILIGYPGNRLSVEEGQPSRSKRSSSPVSAP